MKWSNRDTKQLHTVYSSYNTVSMAKPMSLTRTENATCSGKQKGIYYDYYFMKNGHGKHDRIY